ncbi:hemolysin III family protein [Rothia sp. ZJ932]|nr:MULTISPECIES: hemolysin III family protein [unclassified Rothia (in: high G+C Gram-positive bacteria)]MBM7051442.1 hemolysin III family protein [Rothia sp. ZJ1223]QRZ62639.1 hemolysin III family protein [Rothia sp. ZJ932]
MRGWLHAGFAPLVFVAGIVLVALSGGSLMGLACAIFALTGVLLFGVSGMYHRAYWSDKWRLVFKRLDHANIALVIAGTYTPLAVGLLQQPQRGILLWIIWGCAIAVVLFRVLWTHAPRWLYTPIYAVMGLIAVFYLPDFWQVSPAASVLIAVGGAIYILGAIFYGTKYPKLSPKNFGFHELFHACTLVGFILHYIAVMMAVMSNR